MGFKAVHQDLLVRALKDPVVAFDARALNPEDGTGLKLPRIARIRMTALFPTRIAVNQGPREAAFDSRKGILG